MDPNAALDELRVAVEDYHAAPVDSVDRLYAADAVVEAIEGLDGWLASGGFRPCAWGGEHVPSTPTFEGDEISCHRCGATLVA